MRERWAALGIPGAIDIHTHFMPANVMAKVWAYFDRIEADFGQPWPITYRFDNDRCAEILEDFGLVAHTALNYPHRPDMATWLNEWGAAFADSHPLCVRSATFFPEAAAASYVPAAIEAGTRVFKAHLQVGGYDPLDPLLAPVWGAIENAGLPVVFHCGSGPAPGTHTGPAPVAALLARFPRLRLVIAHMGTPEYADFLALAAAHEGVHLDTTMTFTDFTEANAPYPRELLPRLRDLGDRVVFGSDFPNIPYTYDVAIDALERLDLGEEWLRAVLHDNAARLLDL
ncbi:amidohydrolase [Nocardioides humilatus]|uniref:Amidohydrolase n=1 Tax=Nocardioides humilatus TaxID=2607660 RepID=A0A5B1L4U4_9ACTN|nr:amidohydrolase family protein [Nocardioides humilatus]KAA1415535.1 amidohydrolase [Nocardioides humilatus]